MRKPLEVLILAAALTTLPRGVSFSEGDSYNVPQKVSLSSSHNLLSKAFIPSEIMLHFKNFEKFGVWELIQFGRFGGSYFDFTLKYNYKGAEVSVKYDVKRNPEKDGLYGTKPYSYQVNGSGWKDMKFFKDEVFIPYDLKVLIDILGKNVTAEYTSNNGELVKENYQRNGKNDEGDFIAELE